MTTALEIGAGPVLTATLLTLLALVVRRLCKLMSYVAPWHRVDLVPIPRRRADRWAASDAFASHLSTQRSTTDDGVDRAGPMAGQVTVMLVSERRRARMHEDQKAL